MWNQNDPRICKFWAQGTCNKGSACKFKHIGPPGGGGQRPQFGGFNQPRNQGNQNSFGGFNNNNQNKSNFQTQNRFASLSQPTFGNQGGSAFGNQGGSAFGNQGGSAFSNQSDGGDNKAPPTPDQMRALVINDMKNPPIWPFSCYGLDKSPCAITGDVSPEELRFEAYTHLRQYGNLNQHNAVVNSLGQRFQQQRQHVITNPDSALNLQTTQAGGSVFGTSNTSNSGGSVFGKSSGSVFAAPSQPQQSSIFATPSQTTQSGGSVFGSIQQPIQSSGSVFAHSSQPTQPFGQANSQQQPTSGSVFGQPLQKPQGGSVFGSVPSQTPTFATPSFGLNNNNNTTPTATVAPSGIAQTSNPLGGMNFGLPTQNATTTTAINSDNKPAQPIISNSKYSKETLTAFQASTFSLGNIPEEAPSPEFV